MLTVIGELLPLAVGVAISPVPVIAVILMLLSPRAGATSSGFLLGWVAGLLTVTVTAAVLAEATTPPAGQAPSPVAGWVRIIIGVLLAGLAARQWRSRPTGPDDAPLPAWLAAVEDLTVARATGVGFLLAGPNPKNLLLSAAAGTTLGAAALSTGQSLLALAVYVTVASVTVAGPVLARAVAGDRLDAPLANLKTWLAANNATIMAVLLLVLGVVAFGQGVTALGTTSSG